jgi:hypothetical protein
MEYTYVSHAANILQTNVSACGGTRLGRFVKRRLSVESDRWLREGHEQTNRKAASNL